MRIVLSSILLTTASLGLAQAVKPVTERYKGSRSPKAEYFVLKSDKITKHGEYKAYNSYGKLYELGRYTLGHKDSTWHVYATDGKLSEIQHYALGEQVGAWEKVREGGRVVERVDVVSGRSLPPVIHLYAGYPHLERERGIEGAVTYKLLVSDSCRISGFEILHATNPNFEASARAGLEELLSLARKYGVADPDCEERDEIHTLTFALD